jgi:myo-inositol-1(or 4)-monophosphatase
VNHQIENLLDLSKDTAKLALDKLTEIDNASDKSYTFSSTIQGEMKSEADTIIEKLIISKLQPIGIDIVSEESGFLEGDGNSTLRLIIDPIDGTVNFIRGIASCSVSIALFDGDVPVFGVLGSYPEGKIAWGGNGIGSFLSNDPIKVSNINDPKKGVLCTGFPSRFEFNSTSIEGFTKLMSRFGKIRMLGSASQSLLQVALGSVECYSEQEIMLWDVAAGIAIVEGAGGRVAKRHGLFDFSLNVLADNGLI